ncbi:MAG: 30S ribosomal protein S21 [Gammaproteobacteria bacterium AqS3]|nr:30S ribosomal protein S21 [Gammaproteobacteria bacterium AqS3]
MPSIRINDNEQFDTCLRRFKRACDRAGIINELKRREFHEKPTWKRRRLRKAAVKRQHKKSRMVDQRLNRSF